MMAMCMCMFTACGDDDDDNNSSNGSGNGEVKAGLIGYWAPNDFSEWVGRALEGYDNIDEDGIIDASWSDTYHFINDNTVEKVTLRVSINSRADSFKSETINGIKVYYFFDEKYAASYTYEKIDNKIYIVSAGEILTYNGSTIKVDGRGETLTKVK